MPTNLTSFKINVIPTRVYEQAKYVIYWTEYLTGRCATWEYDDTKKWVWFIYNGSRWSTCIDELENDTEGVMFNFISSRIER